MLKFSVGRCSQPCCKFFGVILWNGRKIWALPAPPPSLDNVSVKPIVLKNREVYDR